MNQSARLGNYQVFTAGKKVDGFRRTLTAVRVGVGSQIAELAARSAYKAVDLTIHGYISQQNVYQDGRYTFYTYYFLLSSAPVDGLLSSSGEAV